jgi:hypothetical protein
VVLVVLASPLAPALNRLLVPRNRARNAAPPSRWPAFFTGATRIDRLIREPDMMAIIGNVLVGVVALSLFGATIRLGK